MATAPQGMDPNAPQSADQSAAPAEESQESFTVCISANADGTYSVYEQDSDDDQDDASGSGSAPGTQGSDDDSGPQTAQSIEDALKIAGQMLQEEASEDSQEPADNSDPQAVWNQLAKKTDAKRGAM